MAGSKGPSAGMGPHVPGQVAVSPDTMVTLSGVTPRASAVATDRAELKPWPISTPPVMTETCPNHRVS